MIPKALALITLWFCTPIPALAWPDGHSHDCAPGLSTAPQFSKEVHHLNAAFEEHAPESLYESIKRQYLNSGSCHRYAHLPASDLEAFRIKLFQPEIEAFRPQSGTSTLSEAQALQNLGHELNFSSPLMNRLQYEVSNLPTGGVDANSRRALFQARIIRLIRGQLAAPENQKNLATREAAFFAHLGIEDCDFISYAAFREAWLAYHRAYPSLKKKNLLTILDRSLSQTGRRMITIDLETKKVLYHSVAGFGDGNLSEKLAIQESRNCSNQEGSSASPYGGSITTITRSSQSFLGPGTFMLTPSPEGSLQDRGIAFHELITGNDVFSSYDSEINSKDRPGQLLNQALENGTPQSVDWFLWKSAGARPNPGPTNGCVGLPRAGLTTLQKTVEGGSFVYFFCNPSDRK